MDASALSRLSTLLDEALDLDAGQREAWLASLGGGDAALAPKLREMLSRGGARETADWLERGPDFTAPVERTFSAPFRDGAMVGPYRLLRAIGQGGMGEVWLAERDDGQLRRRVALKLPVLGLRRDVLVQRFERERDILAALEHPNIARLYDAGVAADGQPYLALEYVDGEPLTAYAEARRLDLDARVRLTVQVLDAVQYAHGKLVVHRDLKPSNVLVDPEGKAMLLDFGIAKLLQAEGHAEETELTRVGGRALTLEFAAPEQYRGEAVSTATDVWALGVLLYELVAGVRPFTAPTAASLEARVLDEDPPPPSRRAARPSRSRAATDLDTIVLKALSKRPSDRYATVDAFARDLRAWLAGESIVARPDGAWRRTARWARRHRVALAGGSGVTAAFVLAFGFGATALVIAALLVGIALALWQAREARLQAARASEQARVAQIEARTAQAVERFLESIFRSNSGGQSDPQRARQRTAKELLDDGAARIADELGDAHEAKLRVLKLMGGLYEDLGELEPASRLAQAAADLARRQFGAAHPLHLSALVSLSRAETSAGRLDESARIARQASMAARGRDDLPPGLCMEIELAFGAALYLKDEPGVLEVGERAVALARQLPDHPDSIDAIILYAVALLGEKRLDEALAAMTEALEAAERRGDAAGAQRSGIHLRIADVFEARGEIDDALRHLRLAAAAARHFAGPGSAQVMASTVVLARFLGARGRHLDALSELDVALSLVESWPASAQRATPLATIQVLRARALVDAGRIDDADSIIGRPDVAEGLAARPDMMAMRDLLGIEIAIWRGRFDDLGARLDDAEAYVREHNMLSSPALGRLRETRCDWLLNTGRLDEAAAVFEALAADRPNDPRVAALGARLALASGRFDRAESVADGALHDLEVAGRLQAAAPVVPPLRFVRGRARMAQGRPVEALDDVRSAVSMWREQGDASCSPWLVHAGAWLAVLEAEAGNPGPAAIALRDAEAILARLTVAAPGLAEAVANARERVGEKRADVPVRGEVPET